MANYAYDKTYASGKVSISFNNWKYWGEGTPYGATYKINGYTLILKNKKIKILDKFNKDITKKIKFTKDFNNDPFNRILLHIIIKELKK